MRFPGFVGPSYVARSLNFDAQRCVNLYPEVDESGSGKDGEVAALVGTPGLRALLTLPTAPVRCVFTASNGRLFAVGGNKVYEISSTYVPTLIGTLTTSVGSVCMADNGFRLAIVDGSTTGFYFKFADSSFTAIAFTTDVGLRFFAGAEQVVFQDGYFIFNNKGTSDFFISGQTGSLVADETTFDLGDFSTAEGSPDPIVSMISNHEEIWLFGSVTTEVFYNATNISTDANGNPIAAFPFQRIQGALIEHGCAAKFSVAKMNNAVFWVGQDDKGLGMVLMAQGYQPQRISTHAVELAIQSYGDISDATAYTYQDTGHQFYVINFRQATWVYDTTTKMWHERSYLADGLPIRHRGGFHTFAFSKHTVGDWENGKIYELSSDVFTDDGVAIRRMRVSPHVTSGSNRVFYHSLQLDIEAGTGTDGINQGNDPKVMLQFSNDGGHSWSSELWASSGRIGSTKHRTLFRRLGQARDRVFKVVITDPVKVAITGAELQFEVGTN